MFRLSGDPTEKAFLHQVMDMSGQNLLECLQCGKCSGSCPITSADVVGPRQLIAQILSGMRQQALTNATWWYCVSCGTCMTRCPVQINMYAVSTALCELAHAGGIAPSEQEIHLFEELFLKSVQKYGRVREIQTVATYNLLTRQPLKDFGKAIALLRKGAISPFDMLSGQKKDPKVSRIFLRAQNQGQGE
jgi:heterodisulfide reductase subunit C2